MKIEIIRNTSSLSNDEVINQVTALDERGKHYPDYGMIVLATTLTGEAGRWAHGQYGWYREVEWGIREYPHDHIADWNHLPNAKGDSQSPLSRI